MGFPPFFFPGISGSRPSGLQTGGIDSLSTFKTPGLKPKLGVTGALGLHIFQAPPLKILGLRPLWDFPQFSCEQAHERKVFSLFFEQTHFPQGNLGGEFFPLFTHKRFPPETFYFGRSQNMKRFFNGGGKQTFPFIFFWGKQRVVPGVGTLWGTSFGSAPGGYTPREFSKHSSRTI